jgi:hypothetical protein
MESITQPAAAHLIAKECLWLPIREEFMAALVDTIDED